MKAILTDSESSHSEPTFFGNLDISRISALDSITLMLSWIFFRSVAKLIGDMTPYLHISLLGT